MLSSNLSYRLNHSEHSSISSHSDITNHYKIILLGDSAVGKSNILLRFTRNTFFTDNKPTIGVEFFSKTVQIQNNKLVKVQIWDTAGQERYQFIASSYYRDAVGAFLVYDVTNRKSFDHVPKWLKEVELHCDTNCRCMLVGNKSDLDKNHQRQVTEKDGEAFAEKNGLTFIETSALSDTNVESAFHKLIQKIYAVQENLDRQKKDEDEILRGVVGIRAGWSVVTNESMKLDRLRSNKRVSARRRSSRQSDISARTIHLREEESSVDRMRKVDIRRCCGII